MRLVHALAGLTATATSERDSLYLDTDALRRLSRQIRLEQSFGGRDLDTLFVTSIRPGAGASEHDGHLFAVRPGVSGLPEPEFAGDL